MYEHSMKIQTNEVKILTLKYTSLPGKRLELGFWIVQNIKSSHCRNLNKGTCPKRDKNLAAEMKLPTSLHTSVVSMNHLYELSISFS